MPPVSRRQFLVVAAATAALAGGCRLLPPRSQPVRDLARRKRGDPHGVFLGIDRAVAQGGQQGGYHLESLAVDKIVALIRRYLADYRALLHQDADCRRALRRILDTFVAVGWPEARRLTYQLDDIFR